MDLDTPSQGDSDRDKGHIAQLRGSRKDDRTDEPISNLVGLALSSGGVRAATYCMGVLHALAQTGLLRAVDYMSCVGGGAYAGGWLAFRSAQNGFEQATQELKERQIRPPDPRDAQLSSYLTVFSLAGTALVALICALWWISSKHLVHEYSFSFA